MTFSIIILNSGCSKKIKSYVCLGESVSSVEKFIQLQKDHYKDPKALTVSRRPDTIAYFVSDNLFQMENLMLFKNDTCYFQEPAIYCSPCADAAVEEILKDPRFNFIATDEVNYISTNDDGQKMVMRLSESNNQSKTCSKIMIQTIQER